MATENFANPVADKGKKAEGDTKDDVEAQKPEVAADVSSPLLEPDEHEHFSQRAPWLRAGVLGATDGLVSVASLMIGVGGGSSGLHIMILAGLAGLVGGALSMAVGEFISVASQKDAEQVGCFVVSSLHMQHYALRICLTQPEPCKRYFYLTSPI